MTTPLLRSLPLAVAVALMACGTSPDVQDEDAPEAASAAPWDDGEQDYGPSQAPDLSGVEEPDPRDEPRSRWGNPDSYEVFGVTYRVMDQGEGYSEEGIASWYGKKFHGRRTSSGEPYDMYAMTAAHKKLPIPIYARVTNLENDRSVVVRINDRGPFAHDRLIDLSYAAAYRLGMVDEGTAPVRVEALSRNLDADETPPGPPREGGVVTVADSSRADVQAAPRVSASVDPEDYYLQAGAFGQRSNAERMKSRLREEAIGSVVIRSSGEDGPYRVWIGPLESRGDAEALQQELATRGLDLGQVVPPNRNR